MPLWPWIDRTFRFDYAVQKWPDILERFRGAPARVEARVRGLAREQLTWSDGGWSIQENVGHLIDLEPLFDGRIDDFLAGREVLRAADMSNEATRRARHNERQIGDLVRTFGEERERAAKKLEDLQAADWARRSIHPRLQIPMRLVDAACFVCEHDDYHIARIGEIVRKVQARM